MSNQQWTMQNYAVVFKHNNENITKEKNWKNVRIIKKKKNTMAPFYRVHQSLWLVDVMSQLHGCQLKFVTCYLNLTTDKFAS
jgi:hypothetical protein